MWKTGVFIKEVHSVNLLNYESYAAAGDHFPCTQPHSPYT
jgi:hypothetical protein